MPRFPRTKPTAKPSGHAKKVKKWLTINTECLTVGTPRIARLAIRAWRPLAHAALHRWMSCFGRLWDRTRIEARENEDDQTNNVFGDHIIVAFFGDNNQDPRTKGFGPFVRLLVDFGWTMSPHHFTVARCPLPVARCPLPIAHCPLSEGMRGCRCAFAA
jgi:hypothetical protein